MPKAVACNGHVHVKDGTQHVLRYAGLENDRVAQLCARERRLRGVLEQEPELAVRIGPRLYFRDEPPVLDRLVAKLGLLQPPVTADTTRTDSPSSSMNAAPPVGREKPAAAAPPQGRGPTRATPTRAKRAASLSNEGVAAAV